MKKASLLIVVLIASCVPVSLPSTPVLSKVIPPITQTISPISNADIPIYAPTFLLTSTATITPEPSKNVLISFFTGGADGGIDWPDDCLMWMWRPQFVLYEDGQLILYKDDRLWEKFLSPQEVDNLLRQIEATGFFQIPEGTDKQGLDLIYKTPHPDMGYGGPSSTIIVKEKKVSIYDALSDYLIKPVEKVEGIIQNYQPSDMQGYIPDELLLGISDVTNSDLKELNYPLIVHPEPSVIPWTIVSPSLAGLVNTPDIDRLKKSDVPMVMPFFPKLPMVRLFSQDERLYIVVACPVLPGATK